MRIRKKKNLKLILIALVIIAIVIIIAAIIYKFMQTSKIEINSKEISASNMGITSEEEAKSWDTSKISEYIVDTSMTDEEGNQITMYVPIPTGFTASQATGETTVKEGLVIYKGNEVVTDSTVTDAKLTKNQWV